MNKQTFSIILTLTILTAFTQAGRVRNGNKKGGNNSGYQNNSAVNSVNIPVEAKPQSGAVECSEKKVNEI